VLDTIAARNPGLISRFGGHAMAAGLSLPRENLEVFRAAFDAVLRQVLTPADLELCLCSDGELSAAEMNLAFACLLRDAGPWGQGFAEPLFDGVFEVLDQRLLAGKHLKMVVTVPGTNRVIDAIAFNTDSAQWPRKDLRQLRLAYRISVNEYRGIESPQLIVEHLETL
jgi:single-stranded-DNA-specific exonuclease